MMLEGTAYYEIVANMKTNRIVDFKEIPGAREGYVMRKLLGDKR